jgi:aminopeptidase N
VVLPQPTRERQSQTLEFQYGGKRVVRKVGAGNFFCQSFGWYPTRENSFATRAHFEINFRTPKKYVLVATGNKVDETIDGDWSITTWKTDVPLAVAGFAFGDYKVYAEKAGAIDVEIYANKNPDDSMAALQTLAEMLDPGTRMELGIEALGSLSPSIMAKTIGTEFANTMRVFENYFGPYPYKRVAITDIPYSYGQGWPGLIYLSALSFLDSYQRHQLGLKDDAGASDSFRAHESSHQWWGHRVGWKSYHDQWLSEGFAQFSGNLYVQFRQNQKGYLTRLKRDKEELLQHDLRNHVYESLGPVWMGHRLGSSESPRGYSTVVYNKGGLILHMLRMMMFDARSNAPDERFIKMMQDFCQTFHNQPASTEDFKAAVERHMIPMMDLEQNRRMDWFFRQYVYGTGLAQYELRYTMQDAGEGKWKISGAVMQSGVADGWMDLIPLYVHTEGRAVRLGAFRVARVGENPFEFVLPFKPEKISVNQNEDTLAKFKQ